MTSNIGENIPHGVNIAVVNNGGYYARVNHNEATIPGKYIYWHHLTGFYGVDQNGNSLIKTSGIMELLKVPPDYYGYNYIDYDLSGSPAEGAIIGGVTSSNIPLYVVLVKAIRFSIGYFKGGDTCAWTEQSGPKCSNIFRFLRFKRRKYVEIFLW